MVIFIIGQDEFQVREALSAELAKVAKNAPVFRLRSDDAEPARLFSYLAAVSLFEPEKTAVVEDLGEFPKAFQKELEAYLEERAELVKDADIQVFITYVLAGDKKKAPKNSAQDFYLKKRSFRQVKLEHPVGSGLLAWVRERALSRGLRLDAGAAAALISQSDASLALLAQEVEKLVLYAGASLENPQELQKKDLAILGPARIDQDAFKLIGAIGAKNHAEMFRILLRTQAQKADPVKLLGLLVYVLRGMLSVKDLESRPIHPQEYARLTGMQDWQMRQYRNAAQRFSVEDLKKIYERLVTVDYRMKTGEGDPRLLLERFLLAI